MCNEGTVSRLEPSDVEHPCSPVLHRRFSLAGRSVWIWLGCAGSGRRCRVGVYGDGIVYRGGVCDLDERKLVWVVALGGDELSSLGIWGLVDGRGMLVLLLYGRRNDIFCRDKRDVCMLVYSFN